jgi:hypothetical protein
MEAPKRPNSDEEYELNQEKEHFKGNKSLQDTKEDVEEDEPIVPKRNLSIDYTDKPKGKKVPTPAIDPMEKETSLFCPWVRVKRGLKMKIVTCLLVLSVFVERYCFLVSVYKTKYFGYLLILFVIFLNVIFQSFQACIRKDKHKRMLH